MIRSNYLLVLCDVDEAPIGPFIGRRFCFVLCDQVLAATEAQLGIKRTVNETTARTMDTWIEVTSQSDLFSLPFPPSPSAIEWLKWPARAEDQEGGSGSARRIDATATRRAQGDTIDW